MRIDNRDTGWNAGWIVSMWLYGTEFFINEDHMDTDISGHAMLFDSYDAADKEAQQQTKEYNNSRIIWTAKEVTREYIELGVTS